MINTLFDTLFAPHVDNHAPFLDCDTGQIITYADFVARTAQIANVLHNAGVIPGDRIVVQAPKVADTIAIYAATVQCGAIYVPLNTAYARAELAYFIGDAMPRLVICDPNNASMMVEICRDSAIRVMTVTGHGIDDVSSTADGQPTTFQTAPRGPDDLAALLYTSGTTGRSKGAMLSHKNLLSNAETLTDHWKIGAHDRLIHALPIFHTHGLFVAINTSVLAGASIRFMQDFNLDAILTELAKSTILMGVPTFYTRLLNDDRLTPDRCTTMRLFISGSAPLLAETHNAFHDKTGHFILERYGMTETNMITSNPYAGARIAGTVGYALPDTEVAITNDGRVVANGEIGMIEVRGDNVFQGYWNMPEKTNEELRENGFFITGDLGIMDNDGRISIVGRHKDLIIAGGYNIYPKEVEDVLNAIDGIVETAVFGVPDPDFGETVLAAIVSDQPDFDVNQIKSLIAPLLGKFKHPRRYILLDSLPRNAMGKVQKNVLRDTHSDAS